VAPTREHVIAEIRRTAEENGGKPLGRYRFADDTGIRPGDWLRYWPRWSEAVREAGFEPNQLQGRYDDTTVIGQLVAEIRRLGRMPTRAEMRLRRRQDPSFPSHGVFEKWGSKRSLIGKVADYCRENGDCTDVLAILEPLLEQEQSTDEPRDDGAAVTFGFVYLLKAGRHYKVGRTNSVGRREYELAIQLPERATLIHQIRTDDPGGIEAYWHRRFAERRTNGEWFELTPEDVRAFRRRKFM
jgi:hypothetical protein